ncbi:hypothetical protein EKN56_12740 [Limnobaculum zhutongyuii]|uniref:Uncharacterized protein n=1 Tax=Limnobaculum zhutongyuii TaxID=2498113 RepID=A0A411WLT2_9GAMM|nr:hypothetical protein [Limnobaculum zhutongyuii]QBH97183.1 hypothetical protein EKN56_12740 [Limnobaculum zhutongyuii]TQS88442.1 hypothetical protein ELQ32_10525 [Limnobaculum zhutongyuii]
MDNRELAMSKDKISEAKLRIERLQVVLEVWADAASDNNEACLVFAVMDLLSNVNRALEGGK